MINIIVAISNNNAIGKKNELLFRIKRDLKYFKHITTDQVVIMGRKTYESIGKPLPNRVNLILTRNKENIDIDGFTSIEEAIEFAKTNYPDKEIFIIGGGQVYKEALAKGLVDRLYITIVNKTVDDADTFFPEIDYINCWEIVGGGYYNEDGYEVITLNFVRQ